MSSGETKKNNENKKQSNKQSWLWLGMLVVVASIAFSSCMIFFGTEDVLPKLFIIPQAVFAVSIAVYKFVK